MINNLYFSGHLKCYGIVSKNRNQKYSQGLDLQTIQDAYNRYQAYFFNPQIQQNIREAKEEQFQEGFLSALFGKILGYTLNPNPNFNLITELKNIANSKKADGAIIIDTKAVAVIELKGTETTDLAKIETQAFGYKNNQPHCTYVIISNFEKLRFYIDNAIEYLEFNLFSLTPEDFNLLWLCLSFKSIEQNIPKKIKEESLSQEKVITKRLYNDYSLFKKDLYQDLVTLNPSYEPLELFRKSQKLLDRFLFIFFAEDRHLLPPNSVRIILNQWQQLKDLDEAVSLYKRFKKYFGYMNTGYVGKQHDVFAYNGGLFKPDEILDTVTITDDVLYKHTLKLSEYDFASEVDVNILGHIFENSLNELDKIKAEIEGQLIDKTKTKRKTDGVFYTPKYITKYIVENTVGKLCTEKKETIELEEEQYTNDKKKTTKTKKGLLDKLTEYRQWLLQLTICDPACGSGAFLNQALEFLINEHRYIDELQAKLFGASMILSDIENSILENNLFGVDINEESVEIAQLSLWLRTARRNRKLNSLNNNIKCGNSLIDDPEVAGEKAFNWQKEFPQIFEIKAKKPHHVTWVTHNSRTSQRMIDHNVKKGEAFWIDEKMELVITKSIAETVKNDGLNVMAYNICGDHVHMLLVCEDEELPNSVRKLKGKSSQQLKEHLEIPKEETFSLWAQKYSDTWIDSDAQLWNTVEYIANNRAKHGLPGFSAVSSSSKGLQPLVDERDMRQIIDSMLCDYDHCFRTEYKGGFDVVIGNPPYVQSHSIGEIEKQFIYKNYKTAEYQINTYGIFVEKILTLLKRNSVYGIIIPNYWLSTKYDKQLRIEIFVNNHALEILNTYQVFENATVDTLILTGERVKYREQSTVVRSISNNHKTIEERLNAINLKFWEFEESKEITTNDEEVSISFNTVFKLKGDKKLKDFLYFKKGMQPYEEGKGIPKQTREMMENKVYHSSTKLDETYLPLLGSKHIKRYNLQAFDEYIKYGKNLAAPRNPEIFEGERILINRILSKEHIDGVLLSEEYINNTDVFNLIPFPNNTISIKVLFALIVSKLCATYFKKANVNLNRDAFPKINVNTLETFPIQNITKEAQQPFIEKADLMLSLNKKLQEVVQKFQRTIQRKFELTELPKKLQDYYL